MFLISDSYKLISVAELQFGVSVQTFHNYIWKYLYNFHLNSISRITYVKK